MLIKIDFNSEEALYLQLRNQIIMGIATMELREGDSLPSVRQLAETVGINIQATGEYAQTVSRSVAVLGPLAVTAVCLLMVFISRKVLYPWLISLFSLVLPLVVWLTNNLPT